jgi:hypothetical protein
VNDHARLPKMFLTSAVVMPVAINGAVSPAMITRDSLRK